MKSEDGARGRPRRPQIPSCLKTGATYLGDISYAAMIIESFSTVIDSVEEIGMKPE